MRTALGYVHDLAVLARTGIFWVRIWVSERTVQAHKVWRSER